MHLSSLGGNRSLERLPSSGWKSFTRKRKMQQKSRAVVWEDQNQQPSREVEISTLGLLLDEAIAFKRVREDLIRLLSSDCQDSGICAILDISPTLLEKFKAKVKKKIRKIDVTLEPITGDESRGLTFWEFVNNTVGDLDLLAWPSFYSCMDCVRKEANNVLHTTDKSFHTSWESHAGGRGIFFQRPDLIKLLRTNFHRKYRQDVVRYVTDNKIKVFKIDCKEIDRTTLLPPNRQKGQHLETRVIKFIFVTVQENLFNCVIDARKLANQNEVEKINKTLEVTADNVFLPNAIGSYEEK
jgi:hypothetical protein